MNTLYLYERTDLLIATINSSIPMDDKRLAVKQFLGDVLEQVKPGREPVREEDDFDRGINCGINVAVDEWEAKYKELGIE